jgi:hypothetical protein
VFQKQKQRHFIDCEKRRKAKVGQRRGLSRKKLRKNEKREENSCAKSQNQKKKKKAKKRENRPKSASQNRKQRNAVDHLSW